MASMDIDAEWSTLTKRKRDQDDMGDEEMRSIQTPSIVAYNKEAADETERRPGTIIPYIGTVGTYGQAIFSGEVTHDKVDAKLCQDLKETTVGDIPYRAFVDAAFPGIGDLICGEHVGYKRARKEIQPFFYQFLQAVSGTNAELKSNAFVTLVNFVMNRHYAPLRAMSMGGATIKHKRSPLSSETTKETWARAEPVVKGAQLRCGDPDTSLFSLRSSSHPHLLHSPSACLFPHVTNQTISTSTISWEDVLIPFLFSWSPSSAAPDVPVQGAAVAAHNPSKRSRLEPNGASVHMATLVSVPTMISRSTPRGKASSGGYGGKATGKKNRNANAEPKKRVLKPHERLGAYAVEIMCASGLRQHTYAIFVDDTKLYLWYFDRTGALGTLPIDLSTDEGQLDFLRTFGVLAVVPSHDFGFIKQIDSAVSWPRLSDPSTLELNLPFDQGVDNNYLASLCPLNEERSRGLVGRGSTVYSFEVDDSDAPTSAALTSGGLVRILKLAWQPESRPSEVGFFLRANGGLDMARRISGIPRVRSFGDLAFLSKGIRGRLHSALTPSQDIRAELHEKILAGDRVLRAMTFDDIPVCQTLDLFPVAQRPMDFLYAIYALVNIHYSLAKDADVLHRDINPYNLLFRPAQATGLSGRSKPHSSHNAKPPHSFEERVYLIDLDFAVDLKRFGAAKPKTIEEIKHTFALPFTALDHLPQNGMVGREESAPKPHLYRHDLESFMWSMWWILLGTPHVEGSAERLQTWCNGWMSENMGKNRSSKRGFLGDEHRDASDSISLLLWAGNDKQDEMVAFLNRITLIFLRGYQAMETPEDPVEFETGGGHITITNFLAQFPAEVRYRYENTRHRYP